MNSNDYIKIVYQSEPIGKEKIVLILTTFDIEKFREDEKLKQIPQKRETIGYEFYRTELSNPFSIQRIEKEINSIIADKYIRQIEQMKEELEILRRIKNQSIVNNVDNITNSGDVHCITVLGNITNCDNIYCTEIKGNVVNCDKIIYK